jgi:two-component system, OmpR family, alkaline phosphatase synthesis response regulator PhoP
MIQHVIGKPSHEKAADMKKTIIIIEDENEILGALKYLFEKNGFMVFGFASAEEFFSFKERPDHCVFLIDWNLLGIKGIDIVKTIRLKDKLSAVFMMSANNKPEQIIEGLQSGADDYITKPFNYDELLVRIENAYSKVFSLQDNLMNVGLKLIPDAQSVMKDGVAVNLTSREFVIFHHLYKHPDVASTREELINQFEKDMEMTARNIDVHIFSLRKKMSKVNIGIETVWGTGYKLVL